MGAWNWLDWTLIAIVAVSVVAAFSKGFVRELISLAALVAGVIVAARGYGRAAAWFEDLTSSHQVAQGLAFLALFIGTLLVGAVIAAIAAKLIKKAGVQAFDRFLGGLFGLVRGVAVDCVLLLVLVAFTIKLDAVRKSALTPYVMGGAEAVANVMPDDLKTQFHAGLQKYRVSVNQAESKDK
ncbi:MAG TPA: CvpA family protein [Terriglobia bacterium]|nr:CvpA family protein [Terriglobia bacterium]